MTADTVFALVSSYGALVVLASAYLSCLAVPIPTSLMMLAAGAFAAVGDLLLWQVAGAAYAGAVAGDQTGFRIGRMGGDWLTGRIAARPARAAALARARAVVDRHGGLGVFFSTWAVAPLGPWVNVIAGATGLGWLRFTVWDALGEAVWVALYVGLGFAFASQIGTLATVLSNVAGLLAGGVVTVALALWLRAVLRHGKAKTKM